jgi:asparagine synthetase B (glutamine-hydrolysing)
MCGIIGFFNFENSVELVQRGLDLMKHRGVDGFKLFDGASLGENLKNSSINCVGHRLHAINGFNPMPFLKEDLVLSANCEIYNFKEIGEISGLNLKTVKVILRFYLIFFSKWIEHRFFKFA